MCRLDQRPTKTSRTRPTSAKSENQAALSPWGNDERGEERADGRAEVAADLE